MIGVYFGLGIQEIYLYDNLECILFLLADYLKAAQVVKKFEHGYRNKME